MQKKLIVNADDLGLSEKTNEGIIQAHLNGIVTSATLMMTMPSVGHAIDAIRGMKLDVGLHVDISWGKPVSPVLDIPTLADSSGSFFGKKHLLKRLALNRINPSELETEIRRQVKAFQNTELPLFHIDVHQHFHGFPAVMKAVATVAVSENIPFVRYVNEFSLSRLTNGFIYFMFLLSKRYFPRQIGRADHFLGLSLTDRLDEVSLCRELVNVRSGLTELMCHPGYDDPSLNDLSMLQSRKVEIDALTSGAVRDIISSNNITLTTYRDELQARGEPR
jgi:predicted glycoside hydrolase/deacetylase ChbG (UPF0249 family)